MSHRKVLPHVLFAILVGVFVWFNFSSQITEVGEARESAKVVRVIDGDTIRVSVNNKEETVRLIGIDTPEVVDPRKTIECFGKEASEKAKKLLNEKTISLESDPTQGNRDKYQRLLRYVFINDLNFNKLMISEGFAHEYTYQSNPYKYQLEFINAARQAREQKKGLWSACDKI